MMNVTLRQCFVHSEMKYGRLDQSDFDKIFDTLQSPKLATQDFAALADIHRDMHQLLASANQVSTEYSKTQYFMQAIKDDPAGRYATELFLQQFPYIPDRRFADLFTTVVRHAPTYLPTNVSLGYSSALSTVSVASASAAPTNTTTLAQQISKTQRDLAALLKQQRGTSQPPAPTQALIAFYCVRPMPSLLLSTFSPQTTRFTYASPMVRLQNPSASPPSPSPPRISRFLLTSFPMQHFVSPYLASPI